MNGWSSAAAVPLFDVQVEVKRQELQRLTRTSFARRSLLYFMNCFACQTFWTAVAIYAMNHGTTDLAGWFFSAAAYSGAAVLLPTIHRPIRSAGATAAQSAWRNCGG